MLEIKLVFQCTGGSTVKHLKCYRRSGAAAPLTNRDCPVPLTPACIIFSTLSEDRLNVVLRLLYLALNCEALKGHFAWITRVAPSFFHCA